MSANYDLLRVAVEAVSLIQEMRATLRELVACKDLNDRARRISPLEPGCEREVLMDEWREREPRAWDAARAVLAKVTP